MSVGGNDMNIVKLANSIRSFALGNYIPFQGFDEEVIVAKVLKFFNVSRHDVLLALEYIAQKG